MKNKAGITPLSEHLLSCLLIVCLLAVLLVTLPSYIACADVLDCIQIIQALFFEVDNIAQLLWISHIISLAIFQR